MAVADMDESIKFYTEVMGLEIESKHNPRPGWNITLLKGEGDAMIELHENKENPREPGLFAVGMEVEDINAPVEELRSKGAKITMEPITVEVGTIAFLADPNGAQIGLIQHH
jgi:lactoylglutathione lyase